MTSPAPTDADLVEAWSAGDMAAGNALVERYFSAIYGFLRDKAPPSMVDDLVQRTFEACTKQRDRFRGTTSARAWLLAIARNQLYSCLRRLTVARRARRRLEDMTIDELLPTPSRVAAENERRLLLVKALRRLPIELQLMLELHYWEGLSYVELSEMLEVPVGTIKSRLNRARELLVEALRALGADDGITTTTTVQLEDWIRSLGREPQ